MERLIHGMLQVRLIMDRNSSFASPIMMVNREDGIWRLCIDYRQLNQLTYNRGVVG